MKNVYIDGVKYVPDLVASTDDFDYLLSSDVLEQIAKNAAMSCVEQHTYMPATFDERWKPHQWVLDAMRRAVMMDRINRSKFTV